MEKRKKIVVFVLIAVAAVVVIMGVWWMRAQGRAQRALSNALPLLLSSSGYHFSSILQLDLPLEIGQRQRPIHQIFFKVEGDVQMDGEAPQFVGNLRVDAKGRGTILFSEGELRIFSDQVAFRLEELSSLLNPSGNLIEKWTYVDTPIFITKNPEAAKEALGALFTQINYEGRRQLPGESRLKGWYFTGQPTEEQELVLATVLNRQTSGNQTLHVLARLLEAWRVGKIEIWVDERSSHLAAVHIVFVDEDSEHRQAATLTLNLSEYGKKVAIEKPPRELSVRPEVFGKIFGQGDLQIKTE